MDMPPWNDINIHYFNMMDLPHGTTSVSHSFHVIDLPPWKDLSVLFNIVTQSLETRDRGLSIFSPSTLAMSLPSLMSARKSTVAKSKSLLDSMMSVSTAVEESWHANAKEVREERRLLLTKVHRYFFSLVSHYLGISNEEVEEFVVDTIWFIKILEEFSHSPDTDVVIFIFSNFPPLTFAGTKLPIEVGVVLRKGLAAQNIASRL
ncbi:hypothetical protein Btru_026503 [Bulinus truncatus]|nr:hypothetical protein Btru_026503 [Bulinus truncatus]